ncbi:two-component hybrid sensor and regulator [Scytonema sp. HK-05]|uniref:PAS domain S-box protein n=1 Tax=Scytonema sp. HK-05 TaxID=1137095 RepID=UPI00093751F5|nr:PAS domain S-box protein [Scytonema sp. HK-05]OKH60776.1 histidine kinase [Scytonema sp. HK-05]BAY45073.1 two-component hybrid sensor and regulator [Scytonema sp. HK-05]
MKRDATGKFVNNWASETKQRVSVSLTSTAWRSLDKAAHKRGISRSEVIEHFARSLENEQHLDANVQTGNAQNALPQECIIEQQHTQLIAAQEAERKVAIILESITDAFVAFDRNWRYTYVNQAAAEILHKTPEQLIGKHVWNEVFPDLVGGVAYQEMHRAMAQQVPVSWEEFGEPVQRPLEVNAYPSAEGIAVYFRDISERKQAEAERERLLHELETERTRFEAVLRQMPAGVMIADAATGKLVLANEQAKEIVGYGYEQLLELNEYDRIVSYIPLRSDGQHYTHEDMPLGRSLQTGEVVSNEEMELHREDGNRIFINLNSAPILDNRGRIVAAVVVFQDVTERKVVEQALRESESRLRGLVDANLIGIILGDFQGNILEVNDAWLATLGYTRQEVLSGAVNFLEITPPEFRHLDEQAMAQMKQVGSHAPFEKEYIRKDGTRVPVLIGTAYLGGADDIGIGFLIDLTERKRLESELRQREQQFKMVAENAPDIISRMDAEFRHLYVSPCVELATGIPSEQFIGKTNAQLGMSEDINSIWDDSLRQVFGTGQEQIIEFRFPTPKGLRWYQSRIVPEFASDGSVETVLSIARDVTDYKQVERALRESEERLRLALAAAQMVGWDMDLITNHVVCSPNALEVWGVQEGTAEEFFAVIHPDDRQRIIQAAQRAIAGELSYKQEYRVIAPNGIVRWLNSVGRVYLDATGRGVRIIGVSVDITERKQIEAQRDRLLEREQAARRSAETERKRLHDILMQFPAMIGIVTGPDLVYEFANPTYLQVAGRTRDIIGKSMRDVFPELEGQIYFDVVEEVYRTGETFIRDESPAYWDRNGDGVLEEAFFNCVFPAWRDAEGTIQGVLIYNIEVTEQVRARQQIQQLLENLQQKERQQQFLLELNDAIRAIQDPKEIMWQVVRATGQHFQVTRCTYGEIDSTQEYVIVDRDFCNGVISVAGSHHMDSFGSEIIAELKQGKTIVVDDVDADPRTRGSAAAAFDAIQTKSLLCVPLVKEGRFVALFVLHHVSPRQWTQEDVALMERIAQKTWLAVERSRAEEALRESEAHLQLAVKVGRMGTWDWDMQTGALLWSEGHFTVLGLQPNECEPSHEVWASRIHPDDLTQAEAKFEQAMQGLKEYHHEYRLRWSDGSIHWVEVRGKFTYDSEGNPKHSIGVVIDITERKQVEQEREQLLERERIARVQVEAAQRQLTTIFETSPLGIALLDSEQRFIAINEALAQINGLTREQHLGHSIAELFGQSDPQLVEVFHEIYTTGNPFISPSFAVNVPGRSDRTPGYYNVYYLPTTNSNHQVEEVLVYVVDVTEQVRLERAQHFLSEASAVLASSLDYQTTLERVAQLAVPALADWCTVHMVEEDGSIEQIAVAHTDPAKLEWAHQIRDKYPLNPDDPRGAALTLRTGQSDLLADIPDELLVQAARDPEHLEILRQVGFKSVMSVPLRTQTRILGVISFVSAESGLQYDSIDLQLAEELAHRASLAIDNAQLYRVAQRARAKAEAANRVKDEFLAVLSHELRSPLNPILGWTKILRSKRLDPTKVDQALETIERNAKLQAQLIEDLLDVSRILQGKMTLNVAIVNLAATIEAALETVRLAAEAKNIQIQTTLNPISGTVSGDANRLQQVVWNLLSNAVKFTPSRGRVEVRLEQVGTYAQIQVKDTGIGISPEFLPYVFEYFRQEDGTTTRKFGGLGLGLAIVRHFTELHGGTVQADSPGQNLGATFTVQLPLNVVEQKLSSCNDSQKESVTDLTGIQILVVDDDADMRELAAFILTQSGAQVTTAASGAQALTLLNQCVPDLLLCDIGMPSMDGYSVIRQIRKWSARQGGSIKAIALTAYAGEINQQQALAAGFQMHISKPVEPEQLVQAIVQLVHPIRRSKLLKP